MTGTRTPPGPAVRPRVVIDRAAEVWKSALAWATSLAAAEILWHRRLTPAERDRLGTDFLTGLHRQGAAGMVAQLRGVSFTRAVVEAALATGHLDAATAEWLLRERGEAPRSAEEALRLAVEAGDLVVVEGPREAHWAGERIGVEWPRYPAAWEFFVELARHAKAGQPVDRWTFPTTSDPKYANKAKSRLAEYDGFPPGLADLIEPAGHGAVRLTLPAERVRIFERVVGEELREWSPGLATLWG